MAGYWVWVSKVLVIGEVYPICIINHSMVIVGWMKSMITVGIRIRESWEMPMKRFIWVVKFVVIGAVMEASRFMASGLASVSVSCTGLVSGSSSFSSMRIWEVSSFVNNFE